MFARVTLGALGMGVVFAVVYLLLGLITGDGEYWDASFVAIGVMVGAAGGFFDHRRITKRRRAEP